ncbi:dihydropteroate synthase [Stieleria sp. TO1_6]|uniref:dihydropteroate synthase n=1 Tax=Stieleria tagensis TaxID=2956795 RepID=UPI00209AB872|nr:dihydropteroate synthase [Stieleria tagensis]MCO8123684.1 dihydropteroate synthase [Stieleria tagensis]
MGILNVTPDSFSDGGRHFDTSRAIDVALVMEADGADIIDLGGESTRPYSDPVSASDELRRVIPVVEGLAGQLKIPISIDTSKAAVAKNALQAGAEIINDVTGLQGDPDMLPLAATSDAGLCVMHMQGTPQTMQDDPTYDNVVEDIYRFLQQRFQFCVDAGIDPQRICLDPGIGFGKSHAHNIELLQHTRRFCELDAPILIGHSRKGFIGKLLGDKTADRTAATLGVTLAVAAAGADIVRVHDVKPTVDALRLFNACRDRNLPS